MVPGAEARGLVAPRMARKGGGEQSVSRVCHIHGVQLQRALHLPRPVLTASRPSQTMAQMGPLFMSIAKLAVRCDGNIETEGNLQEIKPAKKGLSLRSASGKRSATSSSSGGERDLYRTVLLKMLLAGGDKLDGDELEATRLYQYRTKSLKGNWQFLLTLGSRSG